MDKSPMRSKSAIQKTTSMMMDTPNDSAQSIKIANVRQNFRKNVEMPIQSIEAIDRLRAPQRCLIHNTILTLYCEIDRKPLCANCMFEQAVHRKHRVIPIGKAINLIRQDVLSFENKIQGCLNQCLTISRKLQENIIKNEREFPLMTEQLKQFYKNMINMLREKQKEQLRHIQQQKQKIKAEILFMDHQIKHISTVISAKLKPINKHLSEAEDPLLSRRGILQIMAKISRVIHTELSDIFPDEDRKIIDFVKFNEVFQSVKDSLNFIKVGISRQAREYSSTSFKYRKTERKPKDQSYDKSRNKLEPVQEIRSVQKKPKRQVTFEIN